MNEERKSKIFFTLFFILVVGLIGTGTYFLYFNKPTKEDKIKTVANKVKKDKSKDYIYYDGIEPLSVELALIYQYPVINFKGEEIDKINNELKSGIEALKGEVVKLDSVSEEERNKAIEPADNIYSAKMRDYKTYTYDRYLSLVIREYTYNCTGKDELNKFKAYVFDVTTGKVLNQSDVLKERDVLFSSIQNQIREHLQNGFNVNEGEEIDIERTINSLNDEATIYIDNEGIINVEYVAKTANNNYNDSIKIK